MITFNKAVEIAESELRKIEAQSYGDLPRLKLLLNETIEEDFGWVFFYNTEQYLSSGNISESLAGNAPFIIDRIQGTIHETGTAEPIEVYIDQFKKGLLK